MSITWVKDGDRRFLSELIVQNKTAVRDLRVHRYVSE